MDAFRVEFFARVEFCGFVPTLLCLQRIGCVHCRQHLLYIFVGNIYYIAVFQRRGVLYDADRFDVRRKTRFEDERKYANE